MPKTDGGVATLGLETIVYDKVCEDIKKLDVNTLTPIEALGKLYEMKKILEGAE